MSRVATLLVGSVAALAAAAACFVGFVGHADRTSVARGDTRVDGTTRGAGTRRSAATSRPAPPARFVAAEGRRRIDLGDGLVVYAYWHPGAHDLPWVVGVHGGSWRYGSADEAVYVSWAEHEQQRGWAAFSIGYRLTPRVTGRGQVADVERAVRWIRTHETAFGLAASKGFLLGHSAGGQLAAITGLSLGGFAGVAGVSGAYDPYWLYRHATDHNLRSDAGLLVGDHVRDAARWDAMEAETYVGRHVEPFLVMDSVHDPLVDSQVARRFAADLLAHAYPASLVQTTGTSHGLWSAHEIALVDEWMDSILVGDHTHTTASASSVA